MGGAGVTAGTRASTRGTVAAALLAGCAALVACSSPGAAKPDLSKVPQEFRAACGHPGAQVTVKTVPVTVRHADCDLTGVTIYHDAAYARVPEPGKTASMIVDTFKLDPPPSGIWVAVDATTLDVTVHG
jgi:hypothetical protein